MVLGVYGFLQHVFAENPVWLTVHLCSALVNTSSSCRRIGFWLMFWIALYLTLHKFYLPLTYLRYPRLFHCTLRYSSSCLSSLRYHSLCLYPLMCPTLYLKTHSLSLAASVVPTQLCIRWPYIFFYLDNLPKSRKCLWWVIVFLFWPHVLSTCILLFKN